MNLVSGNHITLLKNGAEFFPALEEAIDAALEDIHVETYIFEEDQSGIHIANALMRAASRGASVRVVVDGFGSRQTSMRFFDQMRKAGITVLFFRPEHGRFNFSRSRVRRLHRKIVLVDARIGFVGGINLVDDFTNNVSREYPRFDYAVKIEGSIVAEIYPSVYRLWRMVNWFNLKRRGAGFGIPRISIKVAGSASLAFITRDNFRHRRDIEREYRRAIDTAEKEILIASPYFLPGRKLRNALMLASRRGVAVTILLQGAADHPLMQMATRALYDKLLGAGIAIYEYLPAMLHGKVAVIDGCWATVGSSNLDPFSLLLNREANIVALDAPFAETLRYSLMDEMSRNATQLNFAVWQQRGVWLRVKSWFAFRIARLVTGLIGVKSDS